MALCLDRDTMVAIGTGSPHGYNNKVPATSYAGLSWFGSSAQCRQSFEGQTLNSRALSELDQLEPAAGWDAALFPGADGRWGKGERIGHSAGVAQCLDD